MAARVIRPTARGFLHLDSHPDGCARVVEDMWALVPAADGGRRRVAVVVGCSAGYGLDWFRDEVRRLYGFSVQGVDYERPTDPDLDWPESTRGEPSGRVG